MDADLLKGFYLEDLLVEPAKGRVTGPEGSEHLSSRASEILLCLASQPGDVLSRDALLSCVWGDGKGSEESLTHAVSELRHALLDRADDPRFIQTLPRRGYRLLVRPTPSDGDTGTIVIGAQDGAAAETLSLFENLNRRGVLETAVAYLILGWLLIQVADIVFTQLHLPQWVGTFVTVLVIAGFPIALLLSWFLEFRDGKAMLDPMSPEDARRRRFGRTYMSVIGALAIAAVGVFTYDQSIGLPSPEPDSSATQQPPPPALPPVLDNSIAVLPFLNLDGSEETQIFADGLVDDVITQLSGVPGLLVSSRGDAFTLEPNSPSKRVRERLRVSRYLEGSVQSASDELRVIVQMIDSETGFHILSRKFDRPREDFFDVRDEITQITVASVRVTLPPGTQALLTLDQHNPTIDAYLLYRRGLEAARAHTTGPVDQAISWFNAAIQVDEEYAAAHAGKCGAYVEAYKSTDESQYIELAEESCARAQALNANLDVIYLALGELHTQTGRYVDAETAFLRALDTSPSSVEALTGLGEIYQLLQRPEEAEDVLTRAIGLHPGDWTAYNALGMFLFDSGRYLDAVRQFEIVAALNHDGVVGYANLGVAYMLAADFAAAAPAFENAIAIEPRPSIYSNLGLMHYYLADFEAATNAHREATELAPNDYLNWSNLGDAHWAAGQDEASREAFATARSLAEARMGVNPNDPGTLMDLAWIRAMLDDFDESRALITKALTLAPDDPHAHFIHALIQLREEKSEASLESLSAAVERGYAVEMLTVEPHLLGLRDDPRFLALVSGNSPGND